MTHTNERHGDCRRWLRPTTFVPCPRSSSSPKSPLLGATSRRRSRGDISPAKARTAAIWPTAPNSPSSPRAATFSSWPNPKPTTRNSARGTSTICPSCRPSSGISLKNHARMARACLRCSAKPPPHTPAAKSSTAATPSARARSFFAKPCAASTRPPAPRTHACGRRR